MQGEAHKKILFRVRISKADQIVSPNQSFHDNIEKRNVHFDNVQDMHMSLEMMRHWLWARFGFARNIKQIQNFNYLSEVSSLEIVFLS